MTTPAAKTANELSDIEVQRLDAVDKPATRRPWLILKSEGATKMDPQALEKAALALVENLTKDAGAEGLAMSEGSLGALNVLAKSLGLAKAFAPKAPPAAPPPPPAAPPQDPCEELLAQRLSKMEDGIASVTKSVGDLTAKMAAPAAPAAPAPAPAAVAKSVDGVPASAPPASTQARGQDPAPQAGAPELGKGLFTSVIFAPPATPGA